ncbi:hypothetical protein UY3_03552 [Chelonia mydas]|uniref:Uncharacterized protein n=1 Tax=Chelonia mydas TaxID=8469 RepID=M7CED0_CHEMY|nr:hypothetical protein UY3_03552 [Chelonia mydas]
MAVPKNELAEEAWTKAQCLVQVRRPAAPSSLITPGIEQTVRENPCPEEQPTAVTCVCMSYVYRQLSPTDIRQHRWKLPASCNGCPEAVSLNPLAPGISW